MKRVRSSYRCSSVSIGGKPPRFAPSRLRGEKSAPLRVCFVTTTYPLRPGDGIPAFVADLARHLVRDHGIDVRVLALHHAGASKLEIVDGVRIERFQYALDADRQCLAYGGGIPDNLKNLPRARLQAPGFFAAMATAVARSLHDIDIIHAHWIEP